MTTLTERITDPRLDEPYPLTEAQKQQFREDGFIKLKNVFAADVLADYGEEITRLTLAHAPATPLEQRSTYGKAFIQVGYVYNMSEKARAFTFNKRVARIAAELMDVPGVRLHFDQALYKEAGGGFTPWHVDQHYWHHLGSNKALTAWIPLHPVPLENGPLCFGKGSHRKNMGRDLPISDESEKQIKQMIKDEGVIEVFEPYELGEVSFHLGWTLHRAGPNTLAYPRKVHTIAYIERDMPLQVSDHPDLRKELDAWMPNGWKAGDIINGPRTPVLWER